MLDPKDIPLSVKAMLDMQGQVIVITGGAGFLGRHFAAAVAEMGATPVLLDLDAGQVAEAVQALAADGFTALGHHLDITDSTQVQETVARVAKYFGQITGLVNAAAFAMKNLQEAEGDFFAPFETYPRDLWQVSLDVNLTGTFLVTQAVGQVMKDGGGGSIVNIASDVAIISPDQRIYEPDAERGYAGVPFNTPAAYAVSKAGILSMTRYLATYWAKAGIRVNSISPAGVHREQDPAFVAELASRIPLGRMAEPQELKGAVVYLTSNASTFVTGANLVVDGGRTIW